MKEEKSERTYIKNQGVFMYVGMCVSVAVWTVRFNMVYVCVCVQYIVFMDCVCAYVKTVQSVCKMLPLQLCVFVCDIFRSGPFLSPCVSVSQVCVWVCLRENVLLWICVLYVCVWVQLCVYPQFQIEQGQCVMQHRVIDSLTHTHTHTHTVHLWFTVPDSGLAVC